jgi:hypothetical protein
VLHFSDKGNVVEDETFFVRVSLIIVETLGTVP